MKYTLLVDLNNLSAILVHQVLIKKFNQTALYATFAVTVKKPYS